MDLKTLASQSPQVLTVLEAIKNDSNFLNELKANPQEALNKIGVVLNEEELAMVEKVGTLNDLEDEVLGIFDQIKKLFGFK